MKNKNIIAIAISSILLTGCATIVGDKTQLVPISSTPSEASIVITDETGTDIFKGLTPTTVTLPKSDGSYWGGKSFNVEISKAGYETQVIPVKASPNGWYVAGNFVFGGLIGWFIVDPMNGGMYTLSPQQISSSGNKDYTHNNSEKDAISVVLLQDVPSELLGQMKKIN